MSALFNFHSFVTVVLLGICTCTFIKMHFPTVLSQRTGYGKIVILSPILKKELEYWRIYSQPPSIHRLHAADFLVYNTLIASFIHLNNIDKALDLFAKFIEHCVVYDDVVNDDVVITNLIEGYFNRDMDKEAMDMLFSEAEKLLDEMPGRSVKPDAATFRFLINGFFREGRELTSFNKIIGMLCNCDNGLLSTYH